jgi:hypothetical protein
MVDNILISKVSFTSFIKFVKSSPPKIHLQCELSLVLISQLTKSKENERQAHNTAMKCTNKIKKKLDDIQLEIGASIKVYKEVSFGKFQVLGNDPINTQDRFFVCLEGRILLTRRIGS